MNTVETFGTWLLEESLDVVTAAALLIFGWWAAGYLKKFFVRWCDRSDYIDPIVESFLASLLYYGALAFVIIAALSVLGVHTTSLVAVLGAASLAIGLALQGSLTSLAAGVMIILLRPIRIGDYIEVAGEAGTVKSISLFLTELATYDNIQILLPNSAVWGSAITNYSVYPTRMLDVKIGIDYTDSIDSALDALRHLAEQNPSVMADPAPNTFVTGMGDSSVEINLRVWVAASDYWTIRRALTKAAKEKIEEIGLSIPYPHRQIIQTKGPETKAAA